MAVLMDGRWFPYVECSNKKDGKKEAADVALRVLMAEGSYQLNDTPSSVCAIQLLRLMLSCHFYPRDAILVWYLLSTCVRLSVCHKTLFY